MLTQLLKLLYCFHKSEWSFVQIFIKLVTQDKGIVAATFLSQWNVILNTCSLRAGSHWSTESVRCSRECKIKWWSCETRKWACSDLCKFFISTPETAEKISHLILTGSLDFGSSSDLLGFHNNMQARYTLLIKCVAEEKPLMPVYVWQGHTLDSKRSCFGSLVFDDAGKRAIIFMLFCCQLAVTYVCNI